MAIFMNSERRNTMNWSIWKVARVLLVVAVLSGGMLSGASDIGAQEKGNTLAQQIQGSWILVSIYNEQDGKKIDMYGPNPRGSLILTPDGRFSIIVMKASLPKFAANNRMKGTAGENQAVVQGCHAYYGSYAVASEKEHLVNMRIEGSTFPNWDGQDQKRVMIVKGDELRVTNPFSSLGGTNYVVWKRAK
jgi:Lipocalin-like domain